MKDEKWPAGCGVIIGFLVGLLMAAFVTGSTSSCAFYREANRRLKLIGMRIDSPRKCVGMSVTFGGGCAAYEATIKTWMAQAYDRLASGCWKSAVIPGVDAKTVQKIRDRIVDYLTWETLRIECNTKDCEASKSRCAYVDPSVCLSAVTDKWIGLCPMNCPSDLTPSVIHELAHIAGCDVLGWPKAGEEEAVADAFLQACA